MENVTTGATVAMSFAMAIGIEVALLKATFSLMHRAAIARRAELAKAAKAGQ